MEFQGIYVALITPFYQGRLNESKLRELVQFQIENGIDGIVPCGTTGESPALSQAEKENIIRIIVDEAKGRVPIIAGTGSNNTDNTIRATQKAKELGVDAAMVITPYYNKPNQEGLFKHYEAILHSVDIPIVIYNVPGRTAVNMLPSTLKRLSEFKNIVAMKEATGDLNQTTEYKKLCGGKVSILSGEDPLFAPSLIAGAEGIVSVTANLVPGDLKTQFNAFKQNDIPLLQKMHNKLFDLNQALFWDTNPIPVKAALNLLGKDVGETRLPLGPMNKKKIQDLQQILQSYGLL